MSDNKPFESTHIKTFHELCRNGGLQIERETALTNAFVEALTRIRDVEEENAQLRAENETLTQRLGQVVVAGTSVVVAVAWHFSYDAPREDIGKALDGWYEATPWVER